MPTTEFCEVDGCEERVTVGTIASKGDPHGGNHDFCHPHAIEYWERWGDKRTRACTYCRRQFTTFDHTQEFCTACATRSRKCQYCGNQFTPPKATTTVCRWCFYSGKTFEPTYEALLKELNGLRGVRDAGLLHTGGGCWALQVTRDSDGHYMLATEAYLDETQEWCCESTLPKGEDGPWAIGEEYDEDGEWLEDETTPLIMPADRARLIAEVKRFIAEKE